MGIEITRSHDWKPVQGGPSIFTKCSRCHNENEFSLVWDGEKRPFGLGWQWRKVGFQCPICPNVLEVKLKKFKKYLE